jgi:selenocysteine lyase/cysteine desulfurase
MEAIENRVLWLGKRLRFILSEYAKLPVYDLGQEKCALVTFTVPDRSAEQVKADLAKLRINVSVSDRPSTLLDATRRGLPELVRASPHYYNTEEDDFGKLTKALRDTRRG